MGKAISIGALDATKDVTFEFEYIDEFGQETGIFLSVYGDQSDKVSKQLSAMIDADRERDTTREMQRRTGGNRNKPFIKPVAEDKKFNIDSAALRLAGWRSEGQTEGLSKDQLERFTPFKEVFTPEFARQLIATNQHIMQAVVREAGISKNFTKT